MHPFQRQAPHDRTIRLPLDFEGEIHKGQLVRIYGSDFGYVVTPVAGAGDAIAIQLDGFLTQIPMIYNGAGEPLVTGPGPMPSVYLNTIIDGILEIVVPDGQGPGTQMNGRVLGVDQFGTSFAWNPRLGAASAAAGGVTQEDLNASYSQLYAAIMGGAVPADLDTLREIALRFNGLQDALDSKQDQAASLDELSAIDPSTIGKQILAGADAATIRGLIGASAEPVEGAYADKEYVDAQDAATLATVRGGVDGNYDTLAKLKDAIDGKQASSQSLQSYSDSQPTEFGLGIVEAQDGPAVLDLIGAQPAFAPGTYALDSDLDELRNDIPGQIAFGDNETLATIRDGVQPGYDTLAKLAAGLLGKQDHAANLDTLAASTSPTALGLSLLSAQDAAAARNAIGAQAVGAYATDGSVDAKVAAAKAEILGGAGAAYDTLKELQDALGNEADAIAALTAGLANKQNLDATLTALSGKPTTAFGIGLLNQGDAAGTRVTIGAASQAALDAGLAGKQPLSTWLTQTDAAGVALQADFTSGFQVIDPAATLQGYVAVWPAPGDNRFTPFATPVGQFGSTLLSIDGSNAFDRNKLFYANNAGQLSRITLGSFGFSLIGATATAVGQVPYATSTGGAIGYITTTATGRAIMARTPGSVGEVTYATDLVGGLGSIVTTSSGRGLMAFTPTAGSVNYFAAAGGAPSSITAGTLGRGILALATPATGSIPFASDAAGTVSLISSGTGGRNLLTLGLPATGSVPYFTDAAGTASSFVTSVFGRNAAGLANPAAGSIVFASDAVGSVSVAPSNTDARKLLNAGIPAVGTVPLSRYVIPYFYNNGAGSMAVAADLIGGPFGANIFKLTTPASGSIPIASDGVGNVTTIVATTLGQSFITVATAQAARALTGRKAATFYTGASVALAANTPTEVSFSALETNLGFNQADVILSGGRIQASSASMAVCAVSGAVVTDGACDLLINFTPTSTAGVPYAPTAGNGISRPESAQAPASVLVKIPAAGRWLIQGPAFVGLTTTANNSAQLRVTMTTPVGAAAVNVTSFTIRLDQSALEAIS